MVNGMARNGWNRNGMTWRRWVQLRSKIIAKQKFCCARCEEELIFEKGQIHLHHIDENPKHNSHWNLAAMHKACHEEEHHPTTNSELQTSLEQYAVV
jgi:5-methylcytosine-specific restriction endonuclease McrA